MNGDSHCIAPSDLKDNKRLITVTVKPFHCLVNTYWLLLRLSLPFFCVTGSMFLCLTCRNKKIMRKFDEAERK